MKGKQLTAIPTLNVGPFEIKAQEHRFTVE
jgi:hypothetical protein